MLVPSVYVNSLFWAVSVFQYTVKDLLSVSPTGIVIRTDSGEIVLNQITIGKEYRRLARIYHPDTPGHGSEILMKHLNNALSIFQSYFGGSSDVDCSDEAKNAIMMYQRKAALLARRTKLAEEGYRADESSDEESETHTHRAEKRRRTIGDQRRADEKLCRETKETIKFISFATSNDVDELIRGLAMGKDTSALFAACVTFTESVKTKSGQTSSSSR
jgi:hypothetical protein